MLGYGKREKTLKRSSNHALSSSSRMMNNETENDTRGVDIVQQVQ